MFNRKTETEPSGLDKVIDDLQNHILSEECDSDQYAKLIAHLAVLYKLKETNAPKRVDPNTRALIAANLAGIVLILGFEKANVITSKALSFVLKAVR